jgi:hypothetical protein
MAALLGLVGLVFLLSGFLDIAKITDAGLKFVSLTQIHTLPLLNTIPSGWCYMLIGLVIMGIAGAVISRRRVTYITENG